MKYSDGEKVERGHEVVGKDSAGKPIEGVVVTIVHDGQTDHALLGVSVKAGDKPGSGRLLVGNLKSTDFVRKPKETPKAEAKTN